MTLHPQYPYKSSVATHVCYLSAGETGQEGRWGLPADGLWAPGLVRDPDTVKGPKMSQPADKGAKPGSWSSFPTTTWWKREPAPTSSP